MPKVTSVRDRKMTGVRNKWRWWSWNLSRWGTAMEKHDCEGDCGRKAAEVGKGMMSQHQKDAVLSGLRACPRTTGQQLTNWHGVSCQGMWKALMPEALGR